MKRNPTLWFFLALAVAWGFLCWPHKAHGQTTRPLIYRVDAFWTDGTITHWSGLPAASADSPGAKADNPPPATAPVIASATYDGAKDTAWKSLGSKPTTVENTALTCGWNPNGINVSGAGHVIRNFSVTGSRCGLQFSAASNVLVDGYTAVNPHDYGLYFTQSGSLNPSTGCTLKNLHVEVGNLVGLDGKPVLDSAGHTLGTMHATRFYGANDLTIEDSFLSNTATYNGSPLNCRRLNGFHFLRISVGTQAKPSHAPGFGPDSAPGEVTYEVCNGLVENCVWWEDLPLYIYSGAHDITFRGCTIHYTGSHEIISLKGAYTANGITRPAPYNIRFEDCTFTGGSQLYSGTGATFTNCTYNGVKIP